MEKRYCHPHDIPQIPEQDPVPGQAAPPGGADQGETWLGLDVDVKDSASQYFTPRSLIRAMVQAVRPRPGESIGDPACGTGGFFLGAYNYLEENYKLDRDQQLFLKTKTFRGTDIVDGVVRLCAMNLHLHGIGGEESPISVDDSLLKEQSEKVDIVLTNPP